jgi:SAM-dependent methyltransferase
MQRVLEPELMDDPEQARAYAEADFGEPNRNFLDLMGSRFPRWPGGGAVLDLGCGPGDITLRIAETYPMSEVHGLDGSAAMLEFAERARSRSTAGERVRFICGRVPGARLPRGRYDAVVSNSLLHHLHEPGVLWRSIRALAEPGAPILVMDLMRARSPGHAAELVDEYAGGEPGVLRTDFYNSLLAAFEVEEVRCQLAAAGLEGLQVEPVSDRHLAVWGTAPA